MEAQVRPPASPDGPRGLRPVILVVDDEPGLRESFHLILDEDFEVIDVPDGLAALDVVRSSQVDLVLLDIRLPGMDGWEVLSALQGDPVTAEIPVIVVSIVDERARGLAMGAREYLLKPVGRKELRGALARTGALPKEVP